MDNPLEDMNSIVQQLDQISTICRCEYESTTTMLKVKFWYFSYMSILKVWYLVDIKNYS